VHWHCFGSHGLKGTTLVFRHRANDRGRHHRHFGKLDVLVNNAGRRQSAAAQEIGMSASPGAPPPRFNLKSYTRTVDYDTPSMRDEFVRTQAEPGARGGGGVPLVGEQRQLQVVSGIQAWNQVGDASPTPQLAAVADRLHPSF